MKKLATIVFALLLGSAVQAQTPYLSSLYFGLNTELSSSIVFPEHNYGSGDYYNNKLTPGFAGGLTIGTTINDVHSFQVEVLYSLQGQNFTDVHLPDLTEQKKDISLKYVKVPVVYKYTSYFNSYSDASPSFYLLGGLYLSSLQNGEVTYAYGDSALAFVDVVNGGGNTFTIVDPLQTKDLFTNYDFGAILGIGLEFPLANDLSLTIESRTQIGMTDINSLPWRYPSTSKGYRPSYNFMTGIKVGIVYNLFL